MKKIIAFYLIFTIGCANYATNEEKIYAELCDRLNKFILVALSNFSWANNTFKDFTKEKTHNNGIYPLKIEKQSYEILSNNDCKKLNNIFYIKNDRAYCNCDIFNNNNNLACIKISVGDGNSKNSAFIEISKINENNEICKNILNNKFFKKYFAYEFKKYNKDEFVDIFNKKIKGNPYIWGTATISNPDYLQKIKRANKF